MTTDVATEIAKHRIAAKAELEKRGLHLPRKPVFDLPRLTVHLTEQSDDGLMSLLAQLTRYQDYLAGQLVEKEIDEHAVEAMLEVAKARHLAKGWTGSSTERVAVSKAEAALDEDVRTYTDALIACRAKRKLYGVLVESLARDAAVVSREISRRIGREPAERRLDRHGP